MKMIIIVYRESLEEEMHGLLQEHGVNAFTELHKVGGVGETGAAFHSFTWPGVNSMILTALPEEKAEQVAEGLRVFHDRRIQEHKVQIPLRVFVLPCVQVV